MVRAGDFELRLVRGDGVPCPEVEHNGRAYAVASPGTTFVIQVIKHANPFLMPTPGIMHNTCVFVDGQSVGYSMCLDCPNVVSFPGFLETGDTQRCSYRSFVFSAPRETDEKQAAGLNFVEGSIKAPVWLATETGLATEKRRSGPEITNESVARMPEGKKVFMAPSLTTAKGAHKEGRGFSRYNFQRLGPPIATLELRYETATALLLRGVLQGSDPAHRAILQQFPETARDEDSGADEDEGAACSSRAAGRKRARHAPAGQQPKQHGQRRQRRQQREEFIDLTKEPEEDDEVLAARRENKTLECDLTADEEPQWRAVKQEAIEL